MDAATIVNFVVQYLVIPLSVWLWSLHKTQSFHQTEIEVLKAQVTAREQARTEEREATRKQLDQILASVQNLSGRIDILMRNDR